MMNTMSKKHDIEFKPGMQIKGKWHKEVYTIKRKLGSGTVGAVYLCVHNGKHVALKISEQNSSMTIEVNVLKSLGKVQGSHLGPSLLDVDDWISPSNHIYTFYVMEYLQGEKVHDFVQRNGPEWIGVFLLQLLEDLQKLHRAGWVFGDLKTDNLLIVSSPTRIRWVDVGGTTQIGRAIKEYTEFYDRGYWGLGSRRAEPSYDLFASVMVMLAIAYPNRFSKGAQPKQTLMKKIQSSPMLKPFQECLKQAVLGKYQTSAAMKRDIIAVLYHEQKKQSQHKPDHVTQKAPMFIEAGGILVLATVFYLSSLLFP